MRRYRTVITGPNCLIAGIHVPQTNTHTVIQTERYRSNLESLKSNIVTGPFGPSTRAASSEGLRALHPSQNRDRATSAVTTRAKMWTPNEKTVARRTILSNGKMPAKWHRCAAARSCGSNQLPGRIACTFDAMYDLQHAIPILYMGVHRYKAKIIAIWPR